MRQSKLHGGLALEVIREGFLEEVACAKKYRNLVRANRERAFSIGHGCAKHGGEKGMWEKGSH